MNFKNKLIDYCNNITDGEHNTVYDDINGNYYLLSNKNIVNNKIVINNEDRKISEETFLKINRRTQLDIGDVLISTVGTLGKLAIVKEKPNYDFQRSVGIIKCNKEKLNNEYLYYYLSQNYIQNLLINNSKGAVQKCIFINDLKNLKVNFPNIDIQKKRIFLLKLIDQKIELNNKINRELENLAKDIYDYYFIQFDFLDINNNNKPYKSSGGEMVYNEILKRYIPKGWEVKKIIDIIDWIGGYNPPKETFIYKEKRGYIRFIQNRDYTDNNNLTYIKIDDNNKLCNEYDIMIDKYGDAGLVRYGLNGAYNVALSKINIKSYYSNLQEYVRKYFESKSVYNYLHNACMASTRASLNEEIISNLYIVIPTDNLLEKFEKEMKKNINLILNNKKQNLYLSELRDFLLPMLMNGQVEVEEHRLN